jgi:hypothetical protein
MFFGQPTNGNETQIKHVPKIGLAMCVISIPIKIGESHEIQCTTSSIVDPITCGALNISKDALGILLV